MANKKSFILHVDSLGILDELTDEQAGQLFKQIRQYHNPTKPNETQITQVVKLAFHSFKAQFDRDLQKYENKVEANKLNGKLGGRPKKKTQRNPPKPDSDSVSDSDNDKNTFELFRFSYGGKKRGLNTEFEHFKNKHKDWREVLPLLFPALQKQIEWRKSATGFIPEWKNLQTWINQRDWEMEIETPKPVKKELVEIPASEIFTNVKIDYGNR